MKKYKNILLLSAAVLASAQGIMGLTEAVSAQEKALAVTQQKQALPRVSVVLKELPVKYSGQPFKDISHSIYKNYIQEIYKRGITTGYTPTTYNPEGNVNRGEMAIFLYRLAGSPNYTAPFNVFTDINGLTNQKQILWLSATNVTNGTGSHYNPHGNVTRGQMAAFLHRMAVAGGKASASAKYDAYFADAKKHMFANDIGWLRSQGITTGYTPTSFKPDAPVSRGEMAAFISRFYNKFNKQSQPVVDKTSLKVKDSTIFVNDNWKAQDNFLSATDKNGKAVSFSQVKVSGKVDTAKAGTYTITYSYGGKTVEATVTVKENKAAITLTNAAVSMYVGNDAKSALLDNISTLKDKDGNDVADKSVVEISAKDEHNREISLSDLTKAAGVYKVTYNYGGKTAEATVTVKENKAAITLTNAAVSMFTGDDAKSALLDNISTLKDKDGNDVADKSAVEISAKDAQNHSVDLVNMTQTEGEYTVTYSYDGISVEMTVTVKENGASLELKEAEISKGLTATYGEAEFFDNIKSLRDEDGREVTADKTNVAIAVKDAEGQPADISNLTQTEGTYTVTYSYFGKTSEIKFIVDSHIPVLSEDKKTVNVLNKVWSVIRGTEDMGEGNYMLAMQEGLADANFDDNRSNFFDSNDADSDGYQTSTVKTIIDTWYNNNVKDTALENYVQPVVLANPTLGDMINFGILTSNLTSGNYKEFWRSHGSVYRTKVDANKGIKQAFLLSSADVSSGTTTSLDPDNTVTTTTLTSEAYAWHEKMGGNPVWLRSPGQASTQAAVIGSHSTTVDSFIIRNPEVEGLEYTPVEASPVPALAVHID